MKANGMRAWRATARRWRRKQNRANRMIGAPWINDASGRWYRRQRAFYHQRPVIQPRPFSERSLVGMTMGARKRAALSELMAAAQTPEPREVAGQVLDFARREYRIGQRLRPCPGCPDCVTQMQDRWVDGRRVEGEAVRHRNGCSHDDRSGYCCFGDVIRLVGYCDGSGVLPARRHS